LLHSTAVPTLVALYKRNLGILTIRQKSASEEEINNNYDPSTVTTVSTVTATETTGTKSTATSAPMKQKNYSSSSPAPPEKPSSSSSAEERELLLPIDATSKSTTQQQQQPHNSQEGADPIRIGQPISTKPEEPPRATFDPAAAVARVGVSSHVPGDRRRSDLFAPWTSTNLVSTTGKRSPSSRDYSDDEDDDDDQMQRVVVWDDNSNKMRKHKAPRLFALTDQQRQQPTLRMLSVGRASKYNNSDDTLLGIHVEPETLTAQQLWRIDLIHRLVHREAAHSATVAKQRINMLKGLTHLIARGQLGHRSGTAATRITNESIFALAPSLFCMKRISGGPLQLVCTSFEVWEKFAEDNSFPRFFAVSSSGATTKQQPATTVACAPPPPSPHATTAIAAVAQQASHENVGENERDG
jgi:hypothetical protein